VINASQPAPSSGGARPGPDSVEAISYDDQATRFDERVGLSDEAVAAFSAAIIEEAGAGGLVVEIGAGTGRIGAVLIAAGARYLGIDLSGAMLARFRERQPAGADPALLIQADGNQAWPLADQTAQIVFGLRSIHHLEQTHACEQILRVLRPGGVLLIGRVERGDDSLHKKVRRQMHALVREHGFEPRQADHAAAALIGQLVEHGARALPPRALAVWSRAKSPAQLIGDWAGKQGLGGLRLPDMAKRAVLADLNSWAADAFDDVHAPQLWEERLVCTGIRRIGALT
jgi:SAM-dependent methyltransferase